MLFFVFMKSQLYKLNKYLLYTFVFLLPWHTIYILREVFYGLEKWQYGTIGIYTSDIILILWIFLSIYLYKDKILTFVIKKQKFIFIALLISVWSFLSIFWATDKILAFYFALKISLALDLFFLIQIVPTNLRKLSLFFVSSVFVQSLLGLYQVITQQSFSQKFLGLQFHDIWQGGTAIINSDGERWLRMYGGAPHPNIFGGTLFIALLICIYLYLTTHKNIFQKIFLLFSTALFTTGILLTFSRTIWIVSLISLFAIVLFIYKSKVHKIKNIIVPLVLLFLIAFILIITYQNIFFSRTTQNTTLSHNSITDRTLYIKQSLSLIKENALFGVGSNNYTNTLFQTISNPKEIWYYQPVHNVYLLILSELGLIGFFLLTVFIFCIFYNIYLYKKNINLEQFIFITLFISLLFISIFDHWIWTSHFGLFIFFLIAGLSIKQKTD